MRWQTSISRHLGGIHGRQPDAWWRTAVEAVDEVTYLVLGLVALLIGLVIENALRGPVKATKTGGADGGGDGGDGGG